MILHDAFILLFFGIAGTIFLTVCANYIIELLRSFGERSPQNK
jgi:hypothetical protein